MGLMTDEETRTARMWVGIILGIFLIYIVASAGSVVPDNYNVFKYFEEEADVPLVDGEGYVAGIPTEVNVTAQENNTYQILINANESYMGDFEFVLDPDKTLDNTTAYWTATSTDWIISENQLTATYGGQALGLGVTDGNLYLHIDGGDVEGSIDLDISTGIGELDDFQFSIDILI